MLESLDVLIGVTVVMLTLSMAVTVVTQFLTTAINTRGWHLRRGLVDLLGLLDQDLKGEAGVKIATAVLKHPLVSASKRRLGSVVHREEFTRLLMGLACKDGEASSEPGLDAKTRAALADALTRNGIGNPGEVLARARELVLQLEISQPDLTTGARQNVALLREAKSDLVAKVNNWFDQTMDRVSQRFTGSTRAITFAGALVVAVGLQVDTLQLINRLSVDDQLRAQLVAQGQAINEAGQPQNPPPANVDNEAMKYLASKGLITLPTAETWPARLLDPFAVMGMLITALLLSLGAPFWYNALGKLLQLRSALARKDDSQREARQKEPQATQASSPSQIAAMAGERGDLSAAG